MLSTNSAMFLDIYIEAVGSESNGLYVEVSVRWDLPSDT